MRTQLVAACLLIASLADAKDLMLRQRSSGGMVGGTTEETVYITGDKIVTDAPNMRTIVDLGKETITSIDKGKKGYNVTTFAELRAQMDAIRKSIEQLPPEQRKQMGALLDDSEPVTVKATGKTETIAGYTAKEHTLRGGPYDGTVWTTDAIAKPAAFVKWKGVEQSGHGAVKRLGDAMEKLEGFPLRTRMEMKAGPQAVTVSNEVLEVKDASPPADMLKIPSGYTKQAPRAPGPPPQ